MIQIVYYDGGNTSKGDAVETLLNNFPYSYIRCTQKDVSTRIKCLLQLEVDGSQTQPCTHAPEIELMLFHEVSDEQIQAISQALKDAQQHVACKAVVTPHNKEWVLSDLLQEIAEEHAYFNCYDELKKMILELSTLQEDDYSKDSWQVYQQAILQAYVIIQEQKVEKAVLEQLIEQIKQAKLALMQK